MFSTTGHSIKKRKVANDNFMTPSELAAICIKMVPLLEGDTVLDPAMGSGAFYDQFPSFVSKEWCEVDLEKHFLMRSDFVDWIVTNPPYSNLDKWFEKSISISRKGFAFLLGIHNVTPKRIEMANLAGLGLTKIHMCKVYQWFTMSTFIVFERGKSNLFGFTYDRVVW